MTQEAALDVEDAGMETEHGRCPSAFRYWEAREQPEWQRRRAMFCKLTGHDLFPTDEQAQALCEDLFAGDPVAERFVSEVFFGEIRLQARTQDGALEALS